MLNFDNVLKAWASTLAGCGLWAFVGVDMMRSSHILTDWAPFVLILLGFFAIGGKIPEGGMDQLSRLLSWRK
jgi:hypothetical protein